jgi:hypothetical protein
MTLYHSKKATHREYAEKFEQLCSRLQTANIKVDKTRLDHYRKTLRLNESLIREGRLSELPDSIPLPVFMNDVFEANELIETCDKLLNFEAPGIRTRLVKALAGARFISEETSKKSEPRNTLFELTIASILANAGYEVDLDRIEDVRFTLSGHPCVVECKRITSAKLLTRRVKDAVSQIKERFRSCPSTRIVGIVAIEISKLVNPDNDITILKVIPELAELVEQKLEIWWNSHERKLKELFPNRVLGALFYARLPRPIEQPPGLWTMRGIRVFPAHSSSTMSGSLGRELLGRLQLAARGF